jgi:DNA polymerase III delta prime subunit
MAQEKRNGQVNGSTQEVINTKKDDAKKVPIYDVDYKKLSPIVKQIMEEIDEQIVGQEEAKKELGIILTNTLLYDPSNTKPLAVVMFPGPTGVGKTAIVVALAKILYGDPNFNLGKCRIACNDFQASHEISQLKGSPAGYVGYGDKPLLHPENIFENTNKAIEKNSLHEIFQKIVDRDSNHLPNIILLDEFEKAHPDFRSTFISIFDEGSITLKDGTEVDFRNTIFIMTSNVGADEIHEKLEGKGSMGFMKENLESTEAFSKSYYRDLILRSKIFKKEMIGRLGIVPFRPLTKSEYFKRLDMQIRQHNKTFEYTKISLELTSKAKVYLVEQSMKSNLGARVLIKAFEHDILSLYRTLLTNGEIDRKEENTGYQVKSVVIDYDLDKKEFIGGLSINRNIKAVKKELKELAKLKERQKNLKQQEVIISLQDKSFIKTLTSVIIPNLQYYRMLVKERENLLFTEEEIRDNDIDFLMQEYKQELDSIKSILDAFGIQEKDYQIIDADVLSKEYYNFAETYDELNLHIANVKAWNDTDEVVAFSGMFKIIKKYIERQFYTERKSNLNFKQMINGGAGTIDDAIYPFIHFAEKLIEREITAKERTIIVAIFHKEFLRLNGRSYRPELENPEKKKNKDESKSDKNQKENKTKEEPKKEITININFYGSENATDWKTKLKNLFAEDFDKVLLTIKQNLPTADSKEDIIDILGIIKIELEGKLGMNLSSSQSMGLHEVVDMILKEEEILKDLEDDDSSDNPEY